MREYGYHFNAPIFVSCLLMHCIHETFNRWFCCAVYRCLGHWIECHHRWNGNNVTETTCNHVFNKYSCCLWNSFSFVSDWKWSNDVFLFFILFTQKWAKTFTSMTLRTRSGSPSLMLALGIKPALFTRISTIPKSAFISRFTFSISLYSVTSTCKQIHLIIIATKTETKKHKKD